MLRVQKMLFTCLLTCNRKCAGTDPTLCVSLQVSRVLEDLLGDVCQGFYHALLSLDKTTSKRRAFKVKPP